MDVEALYERYGPMVLRRCRRLLRDEERALDAMQEVFVLLLRNEARLNEAAPSSLLMRMATNHCLNELRSRSRKPVDEDDERILQIAALEDLEGQSAARSMLERIFGVEKESTRTMAVMHLLDGMTLEEVAREVGFSVSGVRKRLRGLRETALAMQEVG